jgi:hypothetical protein
MLRLMGCLGRLLALALLVILGALAWMRGPELWKWVRGGDESPAGQTGDATADEALAAAVAARYVRAVEEDSASVSFSARELEAVLRYRLADRLPRGATNPTVRIASGELVLAADFPRDSIPLPSELERVRRILPRQIPIELRGVILSTESGPVLVVQRVHLVGLAVPRRISNRVVEHLGGGEGGTLPSSALPIRLPHEARGAYIDGDRLVLGDLP